MRQRAILQTKKRCSKWVLEIVLSNESQLNIIDIYLLEEFYPNTFIFEAIEQISCRKILFTQEEKERGCKKLETELFLKLKSLIKGFMCLTSLVDLDKNENLLILGLLFTTKQIYLEIFLNKQDVSAADIDEALLVSSEIIALTRRKLFPYIQINATRGIILAATLRANNFFLLGANENINDDLRALRLLAKKYKYIEKESSDLINSIENLLLISNPVSEGACLEDWKKTNTEITDTDRQKLNGLLKDSGLLHELIDLMIQKSNCKDSSGSFEVGLLLQQKKALIVSSFRQNALEKGGVHNVIETELILLLIEYLF